MPTHRRPAKQGLTTRTLAFAEPQEASLFAAVSDLPGEQALACRGLVMKLDVPSRDTPGCKIFGSDQATPRRIRWKVG
jgi:hypothetical protein